MRLTRTAARGPQLTPQRAAWLALAWLSLTPAVHAEDGTVAADEPAPVTLIRPADGTALPSDGRGTRVTLAWRGSRAPAMWYFVEVLASDPGVTREVFTGYTHQTELRVRLDSPGQYAWRVVAVSRVGAHYSVSPWRSFTIEAAPEGAPLETR